MPPKRRAKLAVEGGSPVRDRPLFYGRQSIDRSDERALVAALRSDFLTQGPTIERFEDAVAEYLGVKYGPTPLAVTPDEKDYGLYLNWLHRSDATLTFPQTLILRYAMFEPEERRQPQVAEDYRAWFLARWRSVESTLETRDYLCADRFTMADICVGYALHLARTIGIDDAFTPNVLKWWGRITDRPAYKRAVEL